MKILFLDVDGVVVIDGPDFGVTMEHFNQTALRELARVVHTTGAKIVLHSSWRCHANKTRLLEAALESVGIVDGLFAQTKLTYQSEVNGRIFSEIRVDEILHYLETHPRSDELRNMLLVKFDEETRTKLARCPSEPIERWAVVDDMALEEDGRLGEHFVRTEEFEGLTKVHANRLIDLLGARDDLPSPATLVAEPVPLPEAAAPATTTPAEPDCSTEKENRSEHASKRPHPAAHVHTHVQTHAHAQSARTASSGQTYPVSVASLT